MMLLAALAIAAAIVAHALIWRKTMTISANFQPILDRIDKIPALAAASVAPQVIAAQAAQATAEAALATEKTDHADTLAAADAHLTAVEVWLTPATSV